MFSCFKRGTVRSSTPDRRLGGGGGQYPHQDAHQLRRRRVEEDRARKARRGMGGGAGGRGALAVLGGVGGVGGGTAGSRRVGGRKVARPRPRDTRGMRRLEAPTKLGRHELLGASVPPRLSSSSSSSSSSSARNSAAEDPPLLRQAQIHAGLPSHDNGTRATLSLTTLSPALMTSAPPLGPSRSRTGATVGTA
jgi:hypothetical protein